MNKKHSALTLVIALSLLVFAFALPKASYATEDVAEEDVAVEDIVDDSDDTFGSPVKMTKEEYDKYLPVVKQMGEDAYKDRHNKGEYITDGIGCVVNELMADKGIQDGYYVYDNGSHSKTLSIVADDVFWSHYYSVIIIFKSDVPSEISKYFVDSSDVLIYGANPVMSVDNTIADPIDIVEGSYIYKDFLRHFYTDSNVSKNIKDAGFVPVLTPAPNSDADGMKEDGDFVYKLTYEKVADDKPADKPVVEVKDNDVMKIENKDFKLGTDKNVAVEIQKDFDTFGKDVEVYVDGKLVAPENYTVTKGSIIITFKESFLKTLGEGKHEFKTVFSDNTETETTFNIVTPKKKADAPEKTVVPQTSDVYSAVTVLMTAVSGAAALKASRKF